MIHTDLNTPEISVIMAAYNEMDTIHRAIESILNQSYTEFELIIIDDGSTDETREIISDFSDSRIKLVENDTNKGLPYSLDRGIGVAQGKYIARMDADDVSRTNRLKRQREILLNNQDIQVVGCQYHIIGENRTYLGTIQEQDDRTYDVDDLLDQGQGPISAHGSVMIRQSALNVVNGYDKRFIYSQDLDLWFRLADEYGRGFVHIIPEVLYERYITIEDMKKIPKQQLFAAMAARRARGRLDRNTDLRVSGRFLNHILSEESYSLGDDAAASRYHQRAGHLHWLDGRYIQSLTNFGKCIYYRPSQILHLIKGFMN